MKKLLLGLAAVIILIVAAALIAPFFIPVDTYRAKIIALVKANTGRDLSINGPVSFSLLPSLALEANDVVLSNPVGATSPNMMQLKTLDVKLRLLPLLHGAIEVAQFKLVEPVIALEVDKQGRPNWDLSRPTQAASPSGPAAPVASPAPPAAGGGIPEISLGDLSIVSGQVSYVDQRGGEKRLVSDVNLALSLPDFTGPFNAKGGATWNGEKVALTMTVAKTGTLLGGGTSPITLSLASQPINFDFQGDATSATLAKLVGTVSLSVPSVRGLATWLGAPFAAPGSGFGPLSIQGKIASADAKMTFTDATLSLDAIKGTGALTIDSHGARPALSGQLNLDKLDVNPYLPPVPGTAAAAPSSAAAPAGSAPATSAPATPAATSTGWSDAPIDLSGLKAADADFDLSANAILYRKIEIGKSALALHLKDGRLEADLTEMALYQGKGQGKVVADGSAATPSVAATFNLAGIAIEPLLSDAAGIDRLTGAGGFVLDVAGHGRSQREIIASLNGKGSLDLANGKISGVNLVAFMKNMANAVAGGQGSGNETSFGALTGTYTIANGIVHNDDLKLSSPELPMTGAGKIDLPLRQVDYTLTPSVAGILALPVIITGPWDDLSYRPDPTAMVKDLAQDPGKALGALKGQGSNAKDLLKGLLGK